jgi:hypothetical protein
MNAKKIILIVLSVFVAVSIGYLVYSETGGARRPLPDVTEQETPGNVIARGSNSTSPEKQQLDRIVRVYYFHTTFRCPTCKRIEEYTRNAVLTGFNSEIKKGTMAWKAINMEEPQNRHFVDDFKLYTKSVIVVDELKGKMVRWKVLEKTWELVGDKSGFTTYIQEEVRKYLGGA